MKKHILACAAFLMGTVALHAQGVIDGIRNDPARKYKKAVAKGKNLKPYHAAQGGIEYTRPFDQTLQFTLWDYRYGKEPERPETYEVSYNIRKMWGLVVGWNMNFVKFDPYNSLTFCAGAEMGFAEATAYVRNHTHDMFKTYLRVPLTFGFRHGGEVSFDKSKLFSFGLGVGMAPSWLNDVFTGPEAFAYSKHMITTMPFFYADVGHFIGTQLKLRFSYYPVGWDSYTVENSSSSLSYQSEVVSGASGPLVKFSLMVMPFSPHWSSSRW